jgi:hypothetical protein
MIDLTEDNDPMLFRIQIPTGSLIVQWTEVCAAAQPSGNAQPTVADLASAVRKVTRTPDVAAKATDEVLVAVCERIARTLKHSGN